MYQVLKLAAMTAFKHVCLFIFPATVVVSYFGLLFEQSSDLQTSLKLGIFAALGWFIFETIIGVVHLVIYGNDRSKESSS